jgi:hypothetical protein
MSKHTYRTAGEAARRGAADLVSHDLGTSVTTDLLGRASIVRSAPGRKTYEFRRHSAYVPGNDADYFIKAKLTVVKAAGGWKFLSGGQAWTELDRR